MQNITTNLQNEITQQIHKELNKKLSTPLIEQAKNTIIIKDTNKNHHHTIKLEEEHITLEPGATIHNKWKINHKTTLFCLEISNPQLINIITQKIIEHWNNYDALSELARLLIKHKITY